jgi:proteasome lid subunit RPN8/RPN11
VRISREQWEELVAHAREQSPKECCGYLRCADGTVEEVVRGENTYDSPRYGYVLDPRSLLDAFNLSEDGGQVAIYHSHPRSPAEPSQTDINQSEYPEWLQVIVSPEGEPQVRAWRIADGRVSEEELLLG